MGGSDPFEVPWRILSWLLGRDMQKYVKAATSAVGAFFIIACTACSPEDVVYGSDGATVRAVSNEVISTSNSRPQDCVEMGCHYAERSTRIHAAANLCRKV